MQKEREKAIDTATGGGQVDPSGMYSFHCTQVLNSNNTKDNRDEILEITQIRSVLLIFIFYLS